MVTNINTCDKPLNLIIYFEKMEIIEVMTLGV